jgi:hypothetical protein
MSPPEDADRWFAHYGVADLVRVSDPDKRLYTLFGLRDARAIDLMHPRVWWPWFRTAILRGYGVGFAGANWRQLTGVFVVHRGRVLASIRHGNSAARPNYAALVHGLKLGSTLRDN